MLKRIFSNFRPQFYSQMNGLGMKFELNPIWLNEEIEGKEKNNEKKDRKGVKTRNW